MLMPKVNEISALSAHRREIALVPWPRVANPRGEPTRALDQLRSNEPRTGPQDPVWQTW
jgi:hypothetical protein